MLGSVSPWPQPSLSFSRYDKMIEAAFHEKWWRSKKAIRVNEEGSTILVAKNDPSCNEDCDAREYLLLQYNFSLFFGLSVQNYEASLVSDDTPWDRFLRENPEAYRPGFESLE